MKRSKFFIIPIALITILSLVAPLANGRGNSASASGNPPPVVAYATRTDSTIALRDMPQIPPLPEVLGQVFPTHPPKHLPNREGSVGPSGPDPALQETAPTASTATTGTSFEGLNNVNGVLPPDTNGAIGPNNYVQMVNLSFAVYDRSGNLLLGPSNTNTLWQDFGGACETTNDGDPVVLYDHLADRWMISQLALPNFPRGPFYQCVAVSQTGDPEGAWYRYEFTISSSKLNDYPKFGVWADGYYMSINQYKCNFVRCSWAGAGAVAFERDQMLQGNSARMVYFDLNSVDPNLGGMLPSDLDGPAPAVGTPNYFAQIDDNAWGYSPDQIQIWGFHVDWNNPSSSTFTSDKAIGTAAFDSDLCGYARNCIPQPGGTNLDALSDRLMYRLQYRDFGDYQTLVTNHTVDVDGNDLAGVRWYELRDSGSGWAMYQQGTFSPDSANRWMGSIAMNGAGDIGLGYSVSSSSVYPSIRVTGRLNGDTPGQMTQGEVELATGNGFQQHTSGRWGDYSMMSVDPTDNCTFWYTQEYYPETGSASWHTFIAAFKLSDCSSTTTDSPPTVDITNPADGSSVSGSVTVQISASDVEDQAGSLAVDWKLDDGTWQSTTYNNVTGYYEATWDTTASSNDSHILNARATDSYPNTSFTSNSVNVANITGSHTSVHIGNLDASSTNNGKTWTANVTVTMHDNNEALVSVATVYGTWSNGASGPGSCTTDGNGQCSVSQSGIPKRTGSVVFTVDNVSSTLPYISADNHDPDGDSDGTTITVNKP